MIDAAQAFDEGTPYEDDRERGTLSVEYLADLIVPSGRIVACDAIVSTAAPAFERQVSPGRYPVLLSIANPTTGYFAGKTYPIFAQLRLSERRPVRWEMATRPGESLASLDPDDEDDFYGHPIDSGQSCFMDEMARQYLDDLPDDKDQVFTAALIAEMQRDRASTESMWLAANVAVEPTTGANLVAFMSGFGDGEYPSFWDFDADDNVACLLTDFCIIRARDL